ncbi:MAG: DUF1289 domain-containing protein [Betaproteobacteria bacterium]
MKSMPQRAADALAVPHAVPSPCISVCRMRACDGLCEGCWRTLDEIVNWAQLQDAKKRQVWADLAQRSQGVNA